VRVCACVCVRVSVCVCVCACVWVCVCPPGPPRLPILGFRACLGGYGLPAPGRPPYFRGWFVPRMEVPALSLGTGPERADWLAGGAKSPT
jgi:hypothetical protein